MVGWWAVVVTHRDGVVWVAAIDLGGRGEQCDGACEDCERASNRKRAQGEKQHHD